MQLRLRRICLQKLEKKYKIKTQQGLRDRILRSRFCYLQRLTLYKDTQHPTACYDIYKAAERMTNKFNVSDICRTSRNASWNVLDLYSRMSYSKYLHACLKWHKDAFRVRVVPRYHCGVRRTGSSYSFMFVMASENIVTSKGHFPVSDVFS
jgi:hypothetical protein